MAKASNTRKGREAKKPKKAKAPAGTPAGFVPYGKKKAKS
jgi:hypothetical protein